MRLQKFLKIIEPETPVVLYARGSEDGNPFCKLMFQGPMKLMVVDHILKNPKIRELLVSKEDRHFVIIVHMKDLEGKEKL